MRPAAAAFSARTGAFFDGVSVALMAAVTREPGRAALVDTLTIARAVAAALLLLRYWPNSLWLVLGGAVVGLALSLGFVVDDVLRLTGEPCADIGGGFTESPSSPAPASRS